MSQPYKIISAEGKRVPILISVPHCGTHFPSELKEDFNPSLRQAPDDTDWFVDRLYDFAPSLGMTMITAVNSRWVIDLNRDPESKPLYTDGRIITGLCPTTTFFGEPLYNDKRELVDDNEVRRRLDAYYWPYHQKIDEILKELKREFGQVLLWDCHSIRQIVPTIQREPFPDLILGSADGKSAAQPFIDTALSNLSSGKFKLSHNHPFKGGFITRHFGKPALNQHALQLEMCKLHYMNDEGNQYDQSRADVMRELLKKTLLELSNQLTK